MAMQKCPQCGASTLFSKRATQYLDPQTGEQRRSGNGCALPLTLLIVACMIFVGGWAYLASMLNDCSNAAKAAYTNPASEPMSAAAYQDGCGWMVICLGCIGAFVVIGLLIAGLITAASMEGKRNVLDKTSIVKQTFTCRKCSSEWTVIREPRVS